MASTTSHNARPGRATSAKSHGSRPSLILKTWEMVGAGHPEIGWSDDGAHIIVHSAERAASEVFPHYFPHSQYASWVRGINAHDFRKLQGGDRWQHPCTPRRRRSQTRSPPARPHVRAPRLARRPALKCGSPPCSIAPRRALVAHPPCFAPPARAPDFHRDFPEWLSHIKRKPPPARGRPGHQGRRSLGVKSTVP